MARVRRAAQCLVLALGLILVSGCVNRAPRPDLPQLVETDLSSVRVYPGLRAFPGLYEIVAVQTEPAKAQRGQQSLEADARVTIRLVKDVSEWVRTDGVGTVTSLGRPGIAAYRRFRNGKAGDTFTANVRYRFELRGDTWHADPAS